MRQTTMTTPDVAMHIAFCALPARLGFKAPGARAGLFRRVRRRAACGVPPRRLGERRANVRKVTDMTTWSTDAVAQYFARSQQVLEAAGADRALVAKVAEIAA